MRVSNPETHNFAGRRITSFPLYSPTTGHHAADFARCVLATQPLLFSAAMGPSMPGRQPVRCLFGAINRDGSKL
ncbi:hypothetical protein [Caballeronia sp.]|uniref:hypothetical protein n=1 Tax=Caballeronia sp. TaxID=1931223 RepID=UPI003C6FF7C6